MQSINPYIDKYQHLTKLMDALFEQAQRINNANAPLALGFARLLGAYQMIIKNRIVFGDDDSNLERQLVDTLKYLKEFESL